MPEIALSLENVSKDFGRIIALRNINMELESGEFLSVLGRNGAGKTTLLNIISGTSKPSRGSVSLFGKNPSDKANKTILAVISHEIFLYGNLTALENLEYFAQMYGLEHIPARIAEVLEIVELSHRRFDLCNTFSRGMLQRLTIARALLHKPSLLLLDEPFTGLDQHAISLLMQLLQRLKQEQKTILLTTHDLHTAFEISDRYILLEKHQIQAQGLIRDSDVESIRTRYFSPKGPEDRA